MKEPQEVSWGISIRLLMRWSTLVVIGVSKVDGRGRHGQVREFAWPVVAQAVDVTILKSRDVPGCKGTFLAFRQKERAGAFERISYLLRGLVGMPGLGSAGIQVHLGDGDAPAPRVAR